MKLYFCPKCHKKVIPPKYIDNVKLEGEGCISLKCGDTNCKGVVKIKAKKEQKLTENKV